MSYRPKPISLILVVFILALSFGSPEAARTASTSLVINEIDYDQPGTDTAEYIELKNVSSGSINLDPFAIRLVNGSGGGAAIYQIIDLPNVNLAAGDYYVVCANAATVANCDQDVAPDTNLIQNGAPDAVGLVQGTTLVDTVSYEGDSGAPYTEGSGAGLNDDSILANAGISRCPDGTDTDINNVDFFFASNTPGAANNCPVLIPATITQIQGAAHKSPLLGQSVRTTGIVTARRSNGFYLQDPAGDGDIATSDGLFVFTGSAPSVAVGDSIRVVGTVVEFYPGGFGSGNLSTTEITSPSITPLSSGNPLPFPAVIGNGGRVPPSQIIEDDATGDVETTGVFDPATDGIDFYESLEGMRVQVNNAVAVGPTNDFGEIPVIGDDGANAGTRTPRGGIVVQPGDFNPERVILDDAIRPVPAVNVGDGFTSPVIGVLDYSFGNFKFLVTDALTPVPGGLTAEIATLPVVSQLSVATFNVENLDPGDAPARIAALASEIVNNLRAPDIIGLEEVQDNNGRTNDSVVDASQTYNALIAAIQAAGGPMYAFRDIAPADDQDGGEPGGNIRVGFLFRPDRVTFVDRPGGDATTATTVSLGVDGVELSFSPGRIDPTNPAFFDSRKPLAGEFIFNGETVFVIVNHFNSKGGDNPLFGRVQPPVLVTEAQRIQQAQVVNDFVDSILALDPDAHVIVFGDLNDFPFSTPLAVVAGDVLTNLVTTLPIGEQYTFIFDGNSQVLDNFLVSDQLLSMFDEFDIVHANSEFAVQNTDHDPSLARFSIPRTVLIDIKPGDEENSINLRSRGVVPVAILSEPDFDATAVNPATVTLAGAPVARRGRGRPMASFEDVNHDGLVDLLVHVETEALQLDETDTEAVLEGQTFAGFLIRGVDTVRIVPTDAPYAGSSAYPTFIWEAVSGAICYQIQIDNAPDFSSPVQDATVVEGTQYNASPLPEGQYHWRVRVGGNCVNVPSGPWSEGQTFIVDTP